MKTKVTREKIIDAGFEIVREEGEAKLSVRNVAERVGCSTQPVMYCFKSAGELRAAVLEKADKYHTTFLTTRRDDDVDILVGIGMNYIRFAASEKNLFRFIMMSDKAQNQGIDDFIGTNGAGGLLSIIEKEYGLDANQARDTFEALFICFHGYATLLSYGTTNYDLAHMKKQLIRVYKGFIDDIKTESLPRTHWGKIDPRPLTF